MPTKTKPAGEIKTSADKIQQVHLGLIKSNNKNPRKSAPSLHAMGYPIFSRDEIEGSNKPTLMEMALSDNIELRAEFCRLIERFENRDPDAQVPAEGEEKDAPIGGIVALARSIMMAGGLLQPVSCRPLPDKSGYDLVFGARRCLAVAYNFARTEASLGAKPTIGAKVEDITDAMAEINAIDENMLRLQMNAIEQAQHFHKMKNVGMDVKAIAQKTGIDHQTIRSRLQLLHLKPEEQDKVKNGTMPVTKGLAIVKARKNNKPEPTVTHNKNQTGRTHAPTVSQWKSIYETGEYDGKDIAKMSAREFAAKFVLQVQYESVDTIKKREADAAKAS